MKSIKSGAALRAKLSKYLSISRGKKAFKNLPKNTKLSMALILLLVLVGFWAVLFNENTTQEMAQNDEETVTELETAPAMKAVLSLTEGVVEIRYDQNADWQDTKPDMAVDPDANVRTVGASSRAIIKLEDGSEIRIDANTEIVFESLTESRIVVAQKTGYLYNRITASTKRIYGVHTTNAQFQAVGTAFRTIANGDEEAVEVYQNSVKETSINLSASEGEKLTIKNPAKPSVEKTKEKLSIQLLKDDEFIVWNRELDKKNPDFSSSLGFLSDFDGPTIDIADPAAGSTIQIETEASEGTVNIKGKTEARASLTVESKSQNGSSPVAVSVNPDGSFETGSITAPVGNSVFEFVAKDRVGNESKLNITYTFARKATVQEQALLFSVTSSDKKLNFEWQLVGLTAPEGLKIIGSQTNNPKLGSDKTYATVTSGTAISVDIDKDFKSGKTYYFRLCRYISSTDTCDEYSNEVSIKIP